jgi:molecular chaperone DnaJ
VAEAVRDYYDVLGVSRDAGSDALKRAFRARARLLHPDVSPDEDAEAKFRELAEAYAVLSKPASRLLYDRFGYRGRGAWVAAPDAGHAFQRLFDLSERAKRRKRSRAAAAEIELGFYEAARGGRRTVTYVRRLPCQACEHPPAACPACGGRGHRRESEDAGDVRLLQLVTCLTCGGSGRIASGACEECDGSGEVEVTREAEVTIPAGVEDGTCLPLDDPDGPHVVVGVRPQPRDSTILRATAAVGLAVALAFLAFLLLA